MSVALDVIVKYGVGEKATNDAWADLVRFATHAEGILGADILADLAEAEKAFKERSGQTLPAAYRSAKSVLKNALEHGVPLLSDNGTPLGKTAVSKETTARKKAATPDKEVSVFGNIISNITSCKLAYESAPDGMDKDAARIQLETLFSTFFGD